MSIFDQFKAASDLMKNMSPDQISELMKQADASKNEIENLVRKIVDEEVKKKNLLTREDAEKIFAKK
jgi:BMFP domain-containing protein YqiC